MSSHGPLKDASSAVGQSSFWATMHAPPIPQASRSILSILQVLVASITPLTRIWVLRDQIEGTVARFPALPGHCHLSPPDATQTQACFVCLWHLVLAVRVTGSRTIWKWASEPVCEEVSRLSQLRWEGTLSMWAAPSQGLGSQTAFITPCFLTVNTM